MPILKTKIHEYRKSFGMSQEELAERVSVLRETVGKPENGRYNPSLKLAMDIAACFSVAVEEIFCFIDDEE